MKNKKIHPPKSAKWLFQCFTRSLEKNTISGDIDEYFHEIACKESHFKAKLWYWKQIIFSLLILMKNSVYWSPIMFQHHLKITIRNIWKHKGYSFINISGLAIGMACAIIILLWVQHEISYDRFHENSDQLYRVAGKYENQNRYDIWMPGPLAAYLKDKYPEIENATTFKPWKTKLATEYRSFFCNGAYVDPSFFEMYTFPLTNGNKKNVFANPNSIVLSEELATKFFGPDDPIGKTIQYTLFSTRMNLKISGVIKKVPQNSHIHFDFLVPYEIGYDNMKTWNNKSGQTYVLLNKNSSYSEVGEKFSNILNEYQSALNISLFLQPLKQIHLNPADNKGGSVTSVAVFSLIAFILLLIACVNFMNLSTARSSIRYKEVGIKKVVGSSRIKLMIQFLSESILLSLFALFFALIIVKALLPSINLMLGIQLELLFSKNVLFSLVMITLVTGVISGSYPAFLLSSFRPIKILKKESSSSKKDAAFMLRKVLLIGQFSLSVLFIICITIIYKQMDFIKNKHLGYNKENIIVLQTTGELMRQSLLVKGELLKNPEISSIALSALKLVEWEASTIGMNWTGKETDQDFGLGRNWVGYDYLKTFGMEMSQGRFFSRQFPTDVSEGFVINEAAVKAMEMAEPIGKQITISPGQPGERTGTIIGVVKDYHTESLHKEIRPFLLAYTNQGNYMCIKIKSNQIGRTLNFIENKIKEFVPNDPFIFSFLDDQLNNLYKSEQLAGKLIQYITILAIFISCLGIFGLATFTAERRTKEIGVRKVLGASIFSIISLLNREYLKNVILGNIIAWPLAYYIALKFLQNFSYHISISIWIFLFSCGLSLSIALLTVCYQSLKTARANPVNSLKNE